MPDLGFVLQPTYRTERGRPVVHLYGTLAEGGSFLVRDDRQVPSFSVRSSDAERAVELGADRLVEGEGWRTLDGYEAVRVEVATPRDAMRLRDRLRDYAVPTYEADVRFAMRYLIDRGVRGSVAIDGPWRKGRGIDRIYENPSISPAPDAPSLPLRVLSLDIETSRDGRHVLSIGLYGCGAAEVLLHIPDEGPTPEHAVRFIRERDLIPALCRRVRQLDPDVLTGWSVIDFDLRFLDQVARRTGTRLELGRGGGVVRLRPSRGPRGGLEATIPGRVVLDGIALLRGAFVRMDSYSLGAVSRTVLGEGKLIEGSDRGEEIWRAYDEDRQFLVDYNLADARLVIDILDKLQLIELAVERSRLTGLPVDRVSGAIASFDSLYLHELGRRRVVAPSVGESGTGGDAGLGGEVLEPMPGLYRNVWVFDFKSLYPSVIRTFEVDPLGFAGSASAGDAVGDATLIEAPNGALFARDRGILPALLDDLFPRREAAKAAGDTVASHAIKILMNSFYGVLGTTACRFYEPRMAGAITAWGREILRWTKARLEALGFSVLYGDTDSLFVASGEVDPERAVAAGRDLVSRLDAELAIWVRERWGVESRLELEYEKLYRRLLLQSLRGSRGGARKRYAGLVHQEDDATVASAPGASSESEGTVEYVGLEVVRRDWTDLAKRVQRELYEHLFRDRDVEESLRSVVEAVRSGACDDELVYRKALRKPLADYTATTPPHVAAARKMDGPPPRIVEYVMTRSGPEPAAAREAPFDHEHYVQKQIRPVAEPVLRQLGLDFDRVIGDDSQLVLF